MAILELNHISKIYGDLKALDDVSIQVNKGEWLAIMGPSGSGKSTMMNIIGCMDRPSLGEVLLDGQDISKLNSAKLTDIRRDKIGLIFQQFHMVNYLTAVENIMVSQYYHSMPDEEEALEALGRVGLRERARHLPSQLSGGEQQRVSIARAVAKNPKILLCDEPTGALDSATGVEVLQLLMEQCRKSGTTVIIVTHNSLFADIADTVVRVKNGKIQSVTQNVAPKCIEEVEW